ncbi:MAG: hypothetical protein AMXMBFR53_12860 [Gemmatimonadota bacterium]
MPGARPATPPSLAAALLAAALLAGCADAPFPSPTEETTAQEMGAAAAEQLSGTLVRHLMAALDSAGPAGAIEFCSREALPLTRQAAATVGSVDVKRTSGRVRNPANAPDSLERAALEYFEAQALAGGALPASWLQVEGDVALRYYRPLVVNELCVQCHGPVTSLAPEVLEALSARYPSDQATGYLPGDFRGLIRVRIPREALEGAGS